MSLSCAPAFNPGTLRTGGSADQGHQGGHGAASEVLQLSSGRESVYCLLPAGPFSQSPVPQVHVKAEVTLDAIVGG